ncbi:MAG: endonuclease/exonuclease/phosphatase family protein [Bdellovibrionota bacterium]
MLSSPFRKLALLNTVLMLGFGAIALADNSAGPRKLTVTSFNIRYYGTGGEMTGTPEMEKRDPKLKEFIQKMIPASDIIVFQEITDPARLEKNILPLGWRCLNYDSAFANHQHVVLCHSGNFKIKREPNDNNDIIDEVSIDGGKSRPALHAIVTDSAGKDVARVIGVHLKAYPEESKTRQMQIDKIAAYLNSVSNKSLPVLITGDFNTYNADKTGELKPDATLFDDAFKRDGVVIGQAPHPSKATYKNLKGQVSKFDHFWISPSLKPVGAVKVFGVCNIDTSATVSTTTQGNPYLNLQYYYDNISDHCPVTLTVGY